MTIEATAADIADSLAADVHRGVLKEGDMFPSERELCERFGVGRNIVRDAINKLHGIQLVDHAKGKRPRVATPSLSDVMSGIGDAAKFFFDTSEGKAHLEQARLFLETSILYYAVEHASNAQLARMVEAINECDAAIDDSAAFRVADVKFHRILAEIPGNPIFIALHEAFVEKLLKSRPSLENFGERNKTSNNEHRKIVEAILDKQPETAVKVMQGHLSRNYGTYFHQAIKLQMQEKS